ncbi:MAG: iron-sulfur binding protein [Anaerolineaceae bacterium]|nr:MAG: iron-sulfur binding protein [Anaerolineaceae bacterium]
MDLNQVVKNEARRLGFALAGFTTPDPPPHLPNWERWLAQGRHGQMDYLADRRRADPRALLPGCQSILALAVRYPDPEPAPRVEGPGPHGRVAAYAWGADYHLVLPPRLEALAAFVAEQAGGPVAHRCYTDTGPLLERDLAQRAGLGWIGKNTCLIHPEIGSYFFLAEILLGLEIEPDAPFAADRCGTCTRCLDACPTGALLPGRTLDARRCISYLTIENKGSIPPELRPRMGDWVFGCDLCQSACPWNRRAEADRSPVFQPRAGVPAPDLAADLALTPREFNQKFKDSPVQRARRRGYLRNVAVALGNTGGPEAVPALEKALKDEEPLVREHAAWALERLKR